MNLFSVTVGDNFKLKLNYIKTSKETSTVIMIVILM